MTITINLPKKIQSELEQKAKAKKISIEEYAAEILSESIENEHDFPSVDEVVDRIRSTPPNPKNVREATRSITDVLHLIKDDPNFDLEAWQKEWDKVEEEMKAIELSDDISEGRR
jgi:hypothetical protein